MWVRVFILKENIEMSSTLYLLNFHRMKKYALGVVMVLVALMAQAQSDLVKTKKKLKPNIPGNFVVDLGVNRALSAPNTWNQGFWGSRALNVYYQYPMRFGKSKFSFIPGAGVSLERWKFTNGATLIDTVELVSFPNGVASPNQTEEYNLLSPTRLRLPLLNKSMLVANYFEIPVEFRFDSKPEDISRSINVAVGGRVGVLFDAFTKVKFSDNGEKQTIKNKFNHGLNPIRYGVYTRFGIGSFNWFMYYNLSEMFESNKGPKGTTMNTFTAGISISGF